MSNSSPAKTFFNKYLPSGGTFVHQSQKPKYSKGISDHEKPRIDKEQKENVNNLNSPKKIKTEIRLTFFNPKDESENVKTNIISRKLKRSPPSALSYHTNKKWKTRAVVKERTIKTPLHKLDSSSIILESSEVKRSSLLKSKNYPNRKIPSNEIMNKERKYEKPTRKYDSWGLTAGSYTPKLENEKSENISHKLKHTSSYTLSYKTNRKWRTHAIVKERTVNAPLGKSISWSFFESNNRKRSPSLKPINHLKNKWKTNNSIKERSDKRPLKKSESKSLIEEPQWLKSPHTLSMRNHNRIRKTGAIFEERKSKPPLENPRSWNSIVDPHCQRNTYEIPKEKITNRTIDRANSWTKEQKKLNKKPSYLTLVSHKNRQWQTNVFTKKTKTYSPLEKSFSWILVSDSHRLKASSSLTLRNYQERKLRSKATFKVRRNNKPFKKSGSWSLIGETRNTSTTPKYNVKSHSENALWTRRRMEVQSKLTINPTEQKPLMYWVKTELKYLIAFPVDKQKPPVEQRKLSTHSKKRSDIIEEGKEFNSQEKKSSSNILTEELRSSNIKSTEPHITSLGSVSSSYISAEIEPFEPRSNAKPALKPRGRFCCLKPVHSPPIYITPSLPKENRKRARTLSSIPSIYSWQDNPSNIHETPDITPRISNGKKESEPRILKETKIKKEKSSPSSLTSEKTYSQPISLNNKETEDKKKLIPETKARRKLESTVSSPSSSSLDLDSFESSSEETVARKPRGLFCCLKPAPSPPASKDVQKGDHTQSPTSQSSNWKIKSSEIGDTAVSTAVKPTEENKVKHRPKSISSSEKKPSRISDLKSTTWLLTIKKLSSSSSGSSSSSCSSSSSSSSSSEKKPSRFKSLTKLGKSIVKNPGKYKSAKRKTIGPRGKESFVSISSNENIHCRPPHQSKRKSHVQKDWGSRTHKRRESRHESFSSSSTSSSSSSSEIKTYRPKTLTSGKKYIKRIDEPNSMKITPSPQNKEDAPEKSKKRPMKPRLKESFISISSNETIHEHPQSLTPRKYPRKNDPNNRRNKDKGYRPRLKESFRSISSSEDVPYRPQHSTPKKPSSKNEWDPSVPRGKEMGRRVKESYSSSSSDEKRPRYPLRNRRSVRKKEPITKKERPLSRSSSVTKLSLLPYLTFGKVLPKLESEPSLVGKELKPEEKEEFWRSLNPENKGNKPPRSPSRKTQDNIKKLPRSSPLYPRKSTGKNDRSSPRRTESFSSTETSWSLTSFTSDRSSTSDKSKKRNPLGRLFCFPRSKAK